MLPGRDVQPWLVAERDESPPGACQRCPALRDAPSSTLGRPPGEENASDRDCSARLQHR